MSAAHESPSSDTAAEEARVDEVPCSGFKSSAFHSFNISCQVPFWRICLTRWYRADWPTFCCPGLSGSSGYRCAEAAVRGGREGGARLRRVSTVSPVLSTTSSGSGTRRGSRWPGPRSCRGTPGARNAFSHPLGTALTCASSMLCSLPQSCSALCVNCVCLETSLLIKRLKMTWTDVLKCHCSLLL